MDQTKRQEIEMTANAAMSTSDYGDFQIYVFKNIATDKEHVALVKGNVEDQNNILCRIASECLPGTAFHYNGCECREQMDKALAMIQKEGAGILIYLRQEGRGQGLTTKIRALKNKNQGYDTFTAVELLGVEADVREYWESVEILRYFRIKSIRLMTNNPDKIKEMELAGIKVELRVPVEIVATKQTKLHLIAKQKRGHFLKVLRKV